MGFFDNLIKTKAKQFVTDKIEDKFDNITNSLKKQNSNSTFDSVTKKRNDKNSIDTKLNTIFIEEFSQYEIRRNVSSSDFFAEDGADNYTYGIYLDGEPKAMIMILNGNNEYKKSSVVKAQQACINRGISYMNFMSYMSNHYEYVSNRLHSNI